MPPEHLPDNQPIYQPSPAPTPAPPPPPRRALWQVILFTPFVWFWRGLSPVKQLWFGTLAALTIMGFLVAGVQAIIHPGSSTNHHSSALTSAGSVSSSSLTSQTQLSIVCGPQGKAVKSAIKYHTGSAPYSLAVFKQSIAPGDKRYDYSPTLGFSDPIVGQAVRPVAPADTQLVACVDRVSEAATGQTCPYTPTPLPVYSASYQVSVYETATHRLVAQFPVAASAIKPLINNRLVDNCPTETNYDRVNPRIYYPVSGPDLAAVLKPLVQ